MGRFFQSVLNRPSRSYASEATFPWDPATSQYSDPNRLPYAPPGFRQNSSDLGVRPSRRRRPASILSNDSRRSEPTGPSYYSSQAPDLTPSSHHRHSLNSARRGPSPVPEEDGGRMRRHSSSAKSSPTKGALFEGDLPPLPPIPAHLLPHHHVRFRPEPGEQHARATAEARIPPQRHATRSDTRRESGQGRSGSLPRTITATNPLSATARRENYHSPQLQNGPTTSSHARELRSPLLGPVDRHPAAATFRPQSPPTRSTHSPPPAQHPSDRRHIPSLTLVIAPPPPRSSPPLLSPTHGQSLDGRGGPTSPRVVSFADVVEYSEAPNAYSDEESDHSPKPVQDRPPTPATVVPAPPVQSKSQVRISKNDDVPPVPPRSPKRGTPGARRDSIDSAGTPSSPMFQYADASPASAPHAPSQEAQALLTLSKGATGEASDTQTRRPSMIRHDPYDSSSSAESLQSSRKRASVQLSVSRTVHSPMAPGMAAYSPLHESDHSNANSTASSSVPETVLVSPLSTILLKSSPTIQVDEYEAPSKRASLVLDDAASEKSIYCTPRNSFYFNSSGSRSSLNLDKIREMLAETEGVEEAARAEDAEEKLFMNGSPAAFPISDQSSEHDFPGTFPITPEEQVVPEPVTIEPIEQEPLLERPFVQEPVVQEPIAQEPAEQVPVVPEASVSRIDEHLNAPPVAEDPTFSELLLATNAVDGSDDEFLPAQYDSDHGSFKTAQGVVIYEDHAWGGLEDAAEDDVEKETPNTQVIELPTFQVQPPTPAAASDMTQSPFREIPSPFDPEPPMARTFIHDMPMPGSFIDDDVDLDSFAPDEIAYYNPDGAADGDDEDDESRLTTPVPRAVVVSPPVLSPALKPSGDDTPKWYEPHEKARPRARATSMPSRKQASESGIDTPPPVPPKSKLDRGGRVRGAVVQVLNRPVTPGVPAGSERSSKTRAAAMVEDYNTSTLQRSKSNRSVKSTKSTRSSRSGTVTSQRTIVTDKPERRSMTPQPKPQRRSMTPRPKSPDFPPIAMSASAFRADIPRSASAYEPEGQHLAPESMRRSSSVYETPRQSTIVDENWAGAGAPRDCLGSDMQQRGSGTSSDLSSSSFRTGGVRGAGLGHGGWAAASAEPVKMYVPNDGDGWAAFQPLPPRSRATPLPASRNSSFDLGGGRSSSSTASSSVVPSASASMAGSSQGPWVQSPQMAAVHRSSMISPTSSLSGRPPKSRLNVMHQFQEDSSDGDAPLSPSYASPPPDHPANIETPRPTFVPEGHRTVMINGQQYAEHYDYMSEHSSAHTSPAKNGDGGRWVPDALHQRMDRNLAPQHPPSSRSSVTSAPSMYSQASAPPSRNMNSPLPPLPTDPSPYEAAARAHAARLGLASSLNPSVLTVLPEMSVHDSNQLYLPQRPDSRRFGSSASELGARGSGASPKRSASLFNVKRYSRAASDIGHSPREYASSEYARNAMQPGDYERRHSFDPRRGSYDSRRDAPSRAQSFRAPPRTGDYVPGEQYPPPPSQMSERVTISLDSPDVTPLNNYPLMESSGYDESRGNGYTNMVLPKGGAYKPGDPNKTAPDLQLLGVPSSSMAAITLSSALHNYHLKHESPTPAHLRWTLPPPVDFSTVAPPQRVTSTQILVQVYAVAVDWLDIVMLDDRARGDVGSWIPGRSFVGRCITTGADEKDIARGDIVMGLMDIKRSGALAEYLTVDRRRVARVNPSTHLELEELAALPAQGIAVHRVIRDTGISRGQQALIMDAHEGLPALFCQELTRMGVVVTAVISGGDDRAQEACMAYGARGVLTGAAASIMLGLPESIFAVIVDTMGGTAIANASKRVLMDGGRVISLLSGQGPPSPKSSFKTKFGLGKRKHMTSIYVQPAGAGDAEVDTSGLDYRDVLEEPVLGVLHPAVGEVVPFEQGASVFASKRNNDRLRVAVVRIVN